MTTREAQKLARQSVFGSNGFHHPWRSTAWEIHPIIEIEVLEEVTTDEFARRLNQFKKLTRDFGESARSAFFALLSRPPTHGLATAGHAGRSHARSNR